MKTPFTAFAIAMIVAMTPVTVQAMNTGSLFPTLTFPEPAPAPVSQDKHDLEN